MRLICGVAQLDGALADLAALDAMLTAMIGALGAPGITPRVARRGDGSAAMAVLDFAPDAAATSLPTGPDGTWLAADLRLDRPRDLAATLDLPATLDDEALALAALGRWDADLPDHLHGDVALAAWDPARRRLLLARDAFGVRPLCYTERRDGTIAFASLPRGLHGAGVASRAPDLPALGRLLVEMVIQTGPATGFRDITWLPAGHTLVASPDGRRLHRAWRPSPAQVGRWRGSEDAAAATLRTLLDEAVACRLPARGPVAAQLSGGLDSSAIVVLAARRLRAAGRRLLAFSSLGATEGAPGDEREYVRAVLAQEPDIVWSAEHLPPLDRDGPADPDLPLDGPLGDPEHGMCAAAAAAGAYLMLTGAGGDEGATYNGLNLLAALMRQGHWRALPTELRARGRRRSQSLVRTIGRELVLPTCAPAVPAPLRALRRHLLGAPPAIAHTAALAFLRPAFAAEVAATLEPDVDNRHSPADRIRMLSESYIVGRGTRWSAIGARHGVAFSHPLLDRRIIDFVLSLPLDRLVSRGFSRQPYRNAVAGIVPESIRWRDTKYVVFPDLADRVEAARPRLLERVRQLRTHPAATELVDLDAVAAALGAPANDPRRQFAAYDAMRAIHLAEHVVWTTS